jgi:hypothetical protein
MPVDLPSELLSGPDLGGGFLFQLTRDRPPLVAGFTFHLQEAGSDAGEAPAGSPERLRYEHPSSPCMYGGSGCWHLRFELEPAAYGRVRVAYNRTRFVMGPMLAQASARTAAPIETGMRELLARIAAPLSRAEVPWQVGGSAGAWLRGVPLAPADIDLGLPEGEVRRLEELLEEFLVEPVHPVRRSSEGVRQFGAAFVGTLKAGIRVEWGGAPPDGGSRTEPNEWEGPGWVGRIERVRFEGLEVPVAPIEFELARSLRQGRSERVELITEHLARHGGNRPLLSELLVGSGTPSPAVARVLARLRA